MKTKRLPLIGGILTSMVFGLPNAWAARDKADKPEAVKETQLNGAGKKLLAGYSDQLVSSL